MSGGAELCQSDIAVKLVQQHVIVEKFGFLKERKAVIATVRVENLAFQKSVQARHTFDGWVNVPPDLALIWEGTVEKATDRFGMMIPLPHAKWTGVVEFAIRYQVAGQTYWDNNNSQNYKVLVPS